MTPTICLPSRPSRTAVLAGGCGFRKRFVGPPARVRLGALVVVAVGMGACATVAPEPVRPASPLSAPGGPVSVTVSFEPLEPGAPILVPPVAPEIDEILSSPVLHDEDFAAAVDEWIEYWAVHASGWVPDFIRRMGNFEQSVDSALAELDMPPSLRYLPFIESGYNPRARSGATAVGMWQFMEGTARGFGMEVNSLVDERRNPYKSTEVAVRYLAELRGEFGSWFLALAAYNSGPTRTRRILERHAAESEPSDSLFWALREHFPRETRDFVPKLFAAMLVAGDPARHGYPATVDPPLSYDTVTVPDATTLDVVARAAQSTEEEISFLNPELVRGMTPRGRRYRLRVPVGRSELFETNYALIPPSERVSFLEHVVVSGETLSHIARQYGISVRELQSANPDVRPRYLRIGARLTVPVAPTTRASGS